MTYGKALRNAATGILAGLGLLAGLAVAPADETVPPAVVAAQAARPHHVYLIGSLRVQQPYLDLGTTPDGPAAGYLIIENIGEAGDRLLGASAEGATSVGIVTATNAPADGLSIPPDGQLILKEGEAHLDIRGLSGVTTSSPPVHGTLRFERAGTLPLEFETDRTHAIAADQTAPADTQKSVDLAQ